jgi:hypothetical protein
MDLTAGKRCGVQVIKRFNSGKRRGAGVSGEGKIEVITAEDRHGTAFHNGEMGIKLSAGKTLRTRISTIYAKSTMFVGVGRTLCRKVKGAEEKS